MGEGEISASVYRLYNSRRNLQYIGSTANLYQRISSHMTSGLLRKSWSVRVVTFKNISEARKNERQCIFREQPPINKNHKLFTIGDWERLLGVSVASGCECRKPEFFEEWCERNRREGYSVSQPYKPRNQQP